MNTPETVTFPAQIHNRVIQRVDRAVSMSLETALEQDEDGFLALHRWRGQECFVTLSPVENSPAPDDEPAIESKGRGYTPSQNQRFQLYGVLLDIEPDADAARKEAFYQWAMPEVGRLIEVCRKKLQQQWKEEG